MNTEELELFLFEDLEEMVRDTTIYPIYLPREYKEYEQIMNMVLGGDNSNHLMYSLTYWGADLKYNFPMIADVCLNEGSRQGNEPWIYLTSCQFNIEFLKLELKELFKKSTSKIIKSKNKGKTKSDSISVSDNDIERLIQPFIEALDKIEYGEPVSNDLVVSNKRLIEGIIAHKISKLGAIPINLKVPATEEIITKHLRFYSTYEQSKHVVVSEWFSNNLDSEKPRMHSFVINFTVTKKCGKDYLAVTPSRRTWINEELPRKQTKSSSSLYHFSSSNFVTRTPVTFNKKTKKFEFKNKTDLLNFNEKHEGLDVDDIFSNPFEYGVTSNNKYWWGIPFDVQKSDEDVKRGVALIERQAFKNIFQEVFEYTPISNLEIFKKNKYIEASKGEISNLSNYSNIKRFNLQIWGRESTFNSLCNLIEEDTLKFTYESNLNIQSNSIEKIELTLVPSNAVLNTPVSNRARKLKDEKKKLLKESISNLIHIKNTSDKECVHIFCKDEEGNLIFTLFVDKRDINICLYDGDDEIKDIISRFQPTIFSQSKIINRSTNSCDIEFNLNNSLVPIHISRHNGEEFACEMSEEDLITRTHIIDTCIQKELNNGFDRTSAIIELDNYNGNKSDPKLLIRHTFAQRGIKTQFLVPKDKGIDHRLHACISDTLFKEGIFKRNESIEKFDLYSYIEKSISIDARNTYLSKDPDNKIKKLKVTIPILGRLSSRGLEFKILTNTYNWCSTGEINKDLDKYILDFISKPSPTKSESRICNLENLYKEINLYRFKEKEAILLMPDLYVKDYGQREINDEYAIHMDKISLLNKIKLITISSKSITPGYVTLNKKGRMGVNIGYSVLKDEENRLNDLGYVIPDKLASTMKMNLAKTIFDIEELYHQRGLIELRRFGDIEIEKATEIYKETLKMVPAFVHMTSNNIIAHYFNKLTEYLDSVEYNYSSIYDNLDDLTE